MSDYQVCSIKNAVEAIFIISLVTYLVLNYQWSLWWYFALLIVPSCSEPKDKQ